MTPSRRSARSDRDWLDDIDVCATLMPMHHAEIREILLRETGRAAELSGHDPEIGYSL